MGIGGNDEREQTLNQLLTEEWMALTAEGCCHPRRTNQPETLDKALLRAQAVF